jgi:hypothetical protein
VGADIFYTHIIVRDSVDQTFLRAVDQAKYEFGHGGYTGTLAEKDSYVVIGDAAGPAEALTKAQQLLNDNDPRVDDKRGPAGIILYPWTIASSGEAVRKALIFGWASS